MNEPKRYSFWPQIVHLPGGGGVRAEVHFKVEEDGLFVAHQDYARLKAEVERLTKLCQATSPDGFIHIRDINAAKEGKPSV